MRALNDLELDALKSATDTVPCGTEPMGPGRSGEPLDERVCSVLIRRGLVVGERCYACHSTHLVITGNGLIALRVDNLARAASS